MARCIFCGSKDRPSNLVGYGECCIKAAERRGRRAVLESFDGVIKEARNGRFESGRDIIDFIEDSVYPLKYLKSN